MPDTATATTPLDKIPHPTEIYARLNRLQAEERQLRLLLRLSLRVLRESADAKNAEGSDAR